LEAVPHGGHWDAGTAQSVGVGFALFDNGELIVEVPRAQRPRRHRITVERKQEKAQPQPVTAGSKN